jgi:hypothetical protein
MHPLARACAFVALLAALPARGADRFVATGGADAGNDCLAAASPCRTISRAVTQTTSGDTVNVATGTYRDNVIIEQSSS